MSDDMNLLESPPLLLTFFYISSEYVYNDFYIFSAHMYGSNYFI